MFQQTVGYMPQIGLAGNPVNPSEVVHIHYNPLSDGTVRVGQFCFAKAAEGEGEKFGFASATGAEGAAPLGLVVRNLIGHMLNVTDTHTDVYMAGQHITVAKKGQFYVAVPMGKLAKVGAGVVVNPKTGEMAFEQAEGFVATGWKVVGINGRDYAEEDEIVIIENWG